MNVFINKIAKFLPNSPVENEEMEDYLGNGRLSWNDRWQTF